MKKVVIINGHPYLNESVSNKKIIEIVAQKMPDAEIIKLAAIYPDFKIDVEKEKNRLINSDIIVFQYPVFWYSYPSILHRYVEEVFQHGWAYATNGDKLKGKIFVQSFTTGAPENIFTPEVSGMTIQALEQPLKTTCWLTQMQYAGAVYSTSMRALGLTTPEEHKALDDRIANHADRLLKLLNSLR